MVKRLISCHLTLIIALACHALSIMLHLWALFLVTHKRVTRSQSNLMKKIITSLLNEHNSLFHYTGIEQSMHFLCYMIPELRTIIVDTLEASPQSESSSDNKMLWCQPDTLHTTRYSGGSSRTNTILLYWVWLYSWPNLQQIAVHWNAGDGRLVSHLINIMAVLLFGWQCEWMEWHRVPYGTKGHSIHKASRIAGSQCSAMNMLEGTRACNKSTWAAQWESQIRIYFIGFKVL